MVSVLGLGGTAIGNGRWVQYDDPIQEIFIGLWRWCRKPVAGEESCYNVWDIELIKDSGE